MAEIDPTTAKESPLTPEQETDLAATIQEEVAKLLPGLDISGILAQALEISGGLADKLAPPPRPDGP